MDWGLMRLVLHVLTEVGRQSLLSSRQVVGLLFAELHLLHQEIAIHGETSFICKTCL